MELTIFAKKVTREDGSTFSRFLTRITKKSTGEVETVGVKFREDCGQPRREECPIVIEVDKKNCNFDTYEYSIYDKDGNEVEVRTGKNLWISAWKNLGPYVDTSMDDYF